MSDLVILDEINTIYETRSPETENANELNVRDNDEAWADATDKV